MYDLERGERLVIAVLVAFIIVGTMLGGYRATRSYPLPIIVSVGSRQLNPSGPAVNRTPRVRIDINTADIETLCTLPRIGVSTAQRIIQYRKERSRFWRTDEIMKVKGVGPKTYKRLELLISVE